MIRTFCFTTLIPFLFCFRLSKDVNNLEAVAGYRTARLRWQYTYAPEPPAFRVQICELLPWLPKTSPRCRLRKLSLLPEVTPYVPANDDDHSGQPGSLDMLRKTPRGSYEALIGDLRLLTNYSVAVEPDFGSDSAANAIVYTGTQPREDDRRFQMVTTEFALMTTKGCESHPHFPDSNNYCSVFALADYGHAATRNCSSRRSRPALENGVDFLYMEGL